MSELSYKELQEQGVFDLPYRAFKYMQSQQAKIDELQAKVDGARSHVDHIYNVLGDDPDLAKLLDEMVEILKGNKDEN